MKLKDFLKEETIYVDLPPKETDAVYEDEVVKVMFEIWRGIKQFVVKRKDTGRKLTWTTEEVFKNKYKGDFHRWLYYSLRSLLRTYDRVMQHSGMMLNMIERDSAIDIDGSAKAAWTRRYKKSKSIVDFATENIQRYER